MLFFSLITLFFDNFIHACNTFWKHSSLHCLLTLPHPHQSSHQVYILLSSHFGLIWFSLCDPLNLIMATQIGTGVKLSTGARITHQELYHWKQQFPSLPAALDFHSFPRPRGPHDPLSSLQLFPISDFFRLYTGNQSYGEFMSAMSMLNKWKSISASSLLLFVSYILFTFS